ncbi:acyl-CoA thioesterase [Halorarius halobius]|uniref:acyl-CoA thioesterase n=1 Tax=Halorarius halobius TaxID=2962671 RepID=UPI0020CDD791|nr:acyl-CoA thioesterase [Halorarius halobius]
MTATAPESRASVRLEESYTETSEVVMPTAGRGAPRYGRAGDAREAATNNLGRALGRWVLHRMDICGAIAARRFSRGQVVTAAIEGVDVHAPIDLGDIAVVTGYVYDIGHTSMDVRVDVRAERPGDGETRETASSDLTFVAIDADGESRPVPRLRCRSQREHDLMARGIDA